MSLPGKLCVGILEEDNPLRSYFRFKPLLLDEGGSYVPYEEGKLYPDEGCIRIVPDKNESYHFKARMRQMGLFCVVDLRDHPNDNDKIRPNKNYRPEGDEPNACIIYSDVVRAPAPGMIFDLLPATAAEGPVATPCTSMVLLEKDGAAGPVCYTWEALEGAPGKAALRATPAMCPTEDLQTFEVPGFKDKPLRFAIRAAATMDAVCDAPVRPERPERAEAPKPPVEKPRPVVEKPIDKPMEKPAEKPAERPEAKPTEPIAPPKPVAPAASKPSVEPQAQVAAPKPAEPPKPAKPPKPVEPPKPAPDAPSTPPEPVPPEPPVAPAEPQNDPEKPWIHHDESILPRPVNPHLSRSEQLRAAQAGLNPRRGRSLQELIDEKWQHSRLNQLGMSASPIVTGAPVRNPVDAAVESLRELWAQPDMRQPLIDAVSQVDEFLDSLRAFRERAGIDLVERQLDELEAQRLELLTELDKLKAGSAGLREQLKQEIRQEDAAALGEIAEKTRAAREEQARYEKMAGDARAAAKDARGLLDNLVGDELERKIRDVALFERVQERMALLRGSAEGEVLPATPEKIDINGMIDRLTRRFAAEGWTLDREAAANLCVSLALASTLILTGAPGSGKTAAARMLGDALGLTGAGRVALLPPEVRDATKDSQVEKLRKFPLSPAMVILDDANLTPAPDALRGLSQVLDAEWRTVVTVQDAHSGAPLSAAVLDRGFVVRLSVPEELPWKPAQRKPLPVFAPASLQALRASLPQVELPTALTQRMDALRRALAEHGTKLSRRALDDAWRYCAAMLAILGTDADPDRVFDLAVAQRIMPGLLAAAPIEAVVAFKRLAEDLPLCRELLTQPLPIMIV